MILHVKRGSYGDNSCLALDERCEQLCHITTKYKNCFKLL